VLFSIIVINYNYGRYVSEAIESALAQTYPHVEVVVVDDGSTDDSRKVIESFGGRVMPVFKANGGQGSAYNDGFAASRGQYVLFLDADDLLSPQACEQVVAAFENVVKVQFPLSIVGPDLTPLGSRIPTLQMMDGDVKAILLKFGTYGSPPASGNAFLRSYLEAIFPIPAEEWRMGSDNYLTIQAPFHGRIATVPFELGMYRQHRIHGEQRSGDFHLGIGNASGLEKVLDLVAQDDRFLAETARMHGFEFKSGLRSRNPAFNKNLLCAQLLGRAPAETPNRTQLGLTGFWNCLRFPLYRPKRRLVGALWFLVAGLAPRKTALKTVRFALDPTSGRKPPSGRPRSRGAAA
jgi:glycosyltransferase involved in cell wall biosynthesis